MSEPQKEPGRNDPCPCGSGVKYKHCCKRPELRALHQDYIRQRMLAHLFLDQILRLTGKQFVVVTGQQLKEYPAHARVHMMKDQSAGVFMFSLQPPSEQPVIQAPRRLILPN